jgi:hypothetical protein
MYRYSRGLTPRNQAGALRQARGFRVDGRRNWLRGGQALNQASFGLPGVTPLQAAEVTAALRCVRVAAGDIAPDDPRTPAHAAVPGESAYPETRAATVARQ